MPEKQARMYELYFSYPSELDVFLQKVIDGVLPERSITQMSYYKIVYNFSRLTKTHPEIIVYSHLVGKGEVPDEDLKQLSGLDDITFKKALQKLRKMGLVE